MKFQRSAVAPLNRESLRTLGARSGWLIETPDVIRVGAGRVVDRVELAGGLGTATSATGLALRVTNSSASKAPRVRASSRSARCPLIATQPAHSPCPNSW